MTVAALPATVSYIEDGVSTVFPVPFRFKAAGDLVVDRVAAGVAVRLQLGADYSVTGGDQDSGGTLTRTAATNGATLRINRETARAQPMVYTTGDRFPAESHEQALDRQMLIAQEIDASLSDINARALLAPEGEALAPIVGARPGRVLGFGVDPNVPLMLSGGGADGALREDLADPELGGKLMAFRAAMTAPARDMEAARKDIVSVKDWGAVGDGVTNDRDAIATAFANAPNGAAVFFPAGNYLWNGQIELTGRTDLLITGNNARIVSPAVRFRSFLRLVNCQRITTDGLRWDQGHSILPTYTSDDYASNILNCPIEISGGQRIVVRNGTFANLYTSAVFAVGASDIAVVDNLFTSPVQGQTFIPLGVPAAQWLQHIHLQTCAGIIVQRNQFINAPITNPAIGVCSVYASGISRYASIEENYSEYAGRDNTGTHRLGDFDYYGDVLNPRLANNRSRFLMAQFARVNATRGAIISGNVITCSVNAELDYSGIIGVEGTIFFGGQKGSQDTIVSHNIIDDPAQRHAVAIAGIAYDHGRPLTNFRVTDNIITGCRRSVLARGPQYGTLIERNSSRGAGAGSILIDQQPAITSDLGNEAGSLFRNITVTANELLDGSGGNAGAIIVNLFKSPLFTGTIDHVNVSRNIVRAVSENAGQGITVNLAASMPEGHSRVADNQVVSYGIGIYQRAARLADIRTNRMLNCPTPIFIEAGGIHVQRDGNTFNDGALEGAATLAAGTVSLAATEARVGDRIDVQLVTPGGTPGFLSARCDVNSTIIINSTSNTDTSSVRWRIRH